MGNFGHNLFRHNWLWFGGFLIIARHVVAPARLAARSQPVSRRDRVPSRRVRRSRARGASVAPA